jgi:hypothetical protein
MLTFSLAALLAVAGSGCLQSGPSAADKRWTKARLNSAIGHWETSGVTKPSATALVSCMARHIDYATYAKAQTIKSESQSEPPGFDQATATCVHLNKLEWQFNRDCADFLQQWGKQHPPKRDEPLVIHKIGTRAWVCEAFLFPAGDRPLYLYRPHRALHWDQLPPMVPQPPNTNAVLHADGTVTETS